MKSRARDVWICPECGWPVSWTVYECPNCKYDLDGDEEMEEHRVRYWSVSNTKEYDCPQECLNHNSCILYKGEERVICPYWSMCEFKSELPWVYVPLK